MTQGQKGQGNRFGLSKHTLVMVLGCLVPLAALVVLWKTGMASGYPLLGLILLCPLSHVLLMGGMHGRKDHQHAAQKTPTVLEQDGYEE